MRVLNLEVHNVQRVSHINFNMDGHGLFLVGGKNRQGKSSTLIALLMALSGRSGMSNYPEIALKQGEDEGWITVKLSGETEETHQPGGITVKLRLVRKRNGTVAEEFVVEDVDGDPAPSPRGLLQSLFNLRAFDPLHFESMETKARKVLLEKMLGLDFTDSKEEYDRLYAKRTDLNREAKTIEAQLKGMPAYADCVEVSATELMAELERRQGVNQRNTAVRNQAVETEKSLSATGAAIDDLNQQMEALRKRLDALTEKKTSLESTLVEQKKAIEALADVDIAEVRTKIANVDDNNQKAHANARRKEVSERWQDLGKRIDAINEKLKNIQDTNEKKLREAKFPVEGMSMDADGILLNGLPFDQASCAERIEASVRVGMALNPTLRLMVSQNGGALDDEAIVALDKILAENDFQMIVEVATRSPFDEDLCSVVLKDGKVAKVNAKKPTLFAEPEAVA